MLEGIHRVKSLLSCMDIRNKGKVDSVRGQIVSTAVCMLACSISASQAILFFRL